jgi:hypothetical protein
VDFEPDDDLLESLPTDEAGGTGPDEPPDPTQPDDGEAPTRAGDGEGEGLTSKVRSQRRTGRRKSISDQPAYGFWLVVIALVLITLAYGATVLHYDQAKDVVTVMGVLTGIVGALVGAYFGVRGATYASLVAQERREEAERRDDHERRGDHARRDDRERRGAEERPGGDHRDRRTRRQERGG